MSSLDQHPLDAFTSCVVNRDVYDKNNPGNLLAKKGEHVVVLEVHNLAYLVEIMSDCEPYKPDGDRDWEPYLPWDALDRLLYL